MKIDGLKHPKTKELAYMLNVPLPHAIGLLELLWAFVAQQTPQGNVGKWSNSVIADESGWQDDADTFVDALIKCRFVDKDQTHRLIIHDWEDHVPNWVRAKLKRSGKEILRVDLSSDLRKTTDQTNDPTTSLAKPSLAEPKDSSPPKRGFTGSKKEFFDLAETHGALTEAEDYAAVLTRKKAANTERAWSGRLKIIQSVAAKGQSIKSVIAKSADSGWTGLFEDKPNGSAKLSAAERQDAAAARQAAEFG